MSFLLHIITIIGFTLPLMLGFNLVFGKGKIFHFGPTGVALVAAYGIFVTLAETGSWPLAILIGFSLTLLVSAAFAWLALRLDQDGLGVMTIAMHLALLSVVLNWSSLTRGPLGIAFIPRWPILDGLPAFATVSLIGGLVWFLIFWWVDSSPLGRQLSALGEHDQYAASLGVNRALVTLIAFCLLGAAQMWDNILYPQYMRLLHPNDYQFPYFIFMLMVVVAGKPGSVRGVTVSTILLVFLKEGLRFLPLPISLLGPLRLLLFGLILFIAIWWRRDQLFPTKREV